MKLADDASALLADGLTPQEVIAKLTPATEAEAILLARRLPLLDERPAGDRGAAVARIATRIGLRRFKIAFTPEGRLGDDRALRNHVTPPPTRIFQGDGCRVEYTAGYNRDRDHFSFVGHGQPPKPHALSDSGYWSHFADPDAVIALGGPEAYVAAMTAAGRDGQVAFARGFTGWVPEMVRKRAKPVVGEHTAMVVASTPPVRVAEPPRVAETPAEQSGMLTI